MFCWFDHIDRWHHSHADSFIVTVIITINNIIIVRIFSKFPLPPSCLLGWRLQRLAGARGLDLEQWGDCLGTGCLQILEAAPRGAFLGLLCSSRMAWWEVAWCSRSSAPRRGYLEQWEETGKDFFLSWLAMVFMFALFGAAKVKVLIPLPETSQQILRTCHIKGWG